MTIDKRKSEILNKIVKEYIVQAEPISSDYLSRKCRIGLSPATIRNEMVRLTEEGYLDQPHTSSGRIPTDKGYRFFVDFLIEKEINGLINEKIKKETEKIKKEFKDQLSYLQEINKFLASFSSGFSVSYLVQEKLCLREGWEKIFQNPEFSDIDYTRNFLSMVKCFEENINDFHLNDFSLKVYIGKEFPVSKFHDFGMIVSRCILSDKEAFIAIMGPKRMAYNKNINLVNSIIKIFKENSYG